MDGWTIGGGWTSSDERSGRRASKYYNGGFSRTDGRVIDKRRRIDIPWKRSQKECMQKITSTCSLTLCLVGVNESTKEYLEIRFPWQLPGLRVQIWDYHWKLFVFWNLFLLHRIRCNNGTRTRHWTKRRFSINTKPNLHWHLKFKCPKRLGKENNTNKAKKRRPEWDL